MDAAFASDEDGSFTDDDWAHALGGVHFVLELDGRIVTHASIVERVLEVGDRPLRTGYVEAVATALDLQGAGYGTRVMAEATAHIRERFELGALGTGRHSLLRATRVGGRWSGPAFVRTADGPAPDTRRRGLHPRPGDALVTAARPDSSRSAATGDRATTGEPPAALRPRARRARRSSARSSGSPPSKLARSIHSFGAWKLPSGGQKPRSTTGSPRVCSKVATNGIEPPSRM